MLNTAQKMKFSMKDFFSKCEVFTEEILNGKLNFLCSVKMLDFYECLLATESVKYFFFFVESLSKYGSSCLECLAKNNYSESVLKVIERHPQKSSFPIIRKP